MESQTDSLLVLNTAKSGHSTDPVLAVTQKGKTLLGVKHGIKVVLHLLVLAIVDLVYS